MSGRNGKKGKLISLAIAVGIVSSAFAQDKAVSPPVTAAEPLKLSGFFQTLSTTQKTGSDSLSIRRARFGFAGGITKTLSFKVSFDAVRSPLLLDALADWTPSAAAGVRFGQFKVPFGIENTLSAADLDMISTAPTVAKLAPGQDIGSTGRDIGLAFNGKASIFEYYLGAFNGAGINKADTNDQKDIAARLIVRPLPGLSLGASLYDGRYSAAAGAAPVTRDRTGFEASWATPTLSLKAELIRAVDAAVHKQGWYAQAGYFVVPKKVQALIRFDSLDVNRDAASDRVDVAAAGLTWFIVGKTKLQVNYEHTRNEAGALVNRAFLVQFQLGY
jgi:phosphate-selective porin OprO/OprP